MPAPARRTPDPNTPRIELALEIIVADATLMRRILTFK